MAIINIQPFSRVISNTSKNSLNTCMAFYLYKVQPENDECIKQLVFTYGHDITRIADIEPDAFVELKDLQAFIVNGLNEYSFINNEYFSYLGILYYRNENGDCILTSCPQKYLVGHKGVSLVDENIKVGDYAFYSVNFNDMQGTLPFEHFTSVGDCAFLNSTLNSFKIANQLNYLGRYSFANCTQLANVLAVDVSPLHYISTGTFYNCTALESVQLPEGLIYIGEKAFENCKSLRKIMLPKTLQCICKDAFKGCNNVELIIPEGSRLLHLGISETLYLAAEPDMEHELIFPDEISPDSELSFEKQNRLFAFYHNQYTVSREIQSIGNITFSSKTQPDIVRRYTECHLNAS